MSFLEFSGSSKHNNPMSRSKVVALLFTIFVLPGTGHLKLQRKKTGWVLIVLTLLILALAVYFTVQTVHQEMARWSDPQMLQEHLQEVISSTQASIETTLKGLMWMMMAIWIFAVGDVLLAKEVSHYNQTQQGSPDEK